MDKIEYQDVLPIDTSIPMGIELKFAKADIEDLNNKLKIFKEKDAYPEFRTCILSYPI